MASGGSSDSLATNGSKGKLQEYRQARKAAKSAVTRKENEIFNSMLGYSEEDFKAVKIKKAELLESIKRFRQRHGEFHSLLTDDDDKEVSQEYYDDVESKYVHLMEKVNNYECSVERRLAQGIETDKSLRLGESANGSRNSHRSSLSSAIVKAAAKRAALKAEIASLTRQQELDEQEMKIRQQREKLRLETEMVKLEAEESVLAEAEGQCGQTRLGGATSVTSKESKDQSQGHATLSGGGATGVQASHYELRASEQHPIGGATGVQASQHGLGASQQHLIGGATGVQASQHGLGASQQHLTGGTTGAHPQTCPTDGATAEHLQPHPTELCAPTQYYAINPTGIPSGHSQLIGGSTVPSQLNPLAQEYRPDSENSNLVHIIQEGQHQQRQLLDAMQIPKVELMTFDGDPLKYWGFIRTFDNNVERNTVDSGSKLSRLLQYTTGKAKMVIQSCAVMRPEEGYARARQLLEERFGNAFVITETWINKVTNGPAIKPHERDKIQDYADELRSCADTLQAMGNTAEISSQSSLVKIISRLPFFMQHKWRSKAHQIRKVNMRNPNIDDVTKFVLEAAEVVNDPVYGGLVNTKERPEWQKRTVVRKGSSYNSATEVKSENRHSSSGSSAYVVKCFKCAGAHSLFGCNSFKEMKVEDRLKFVNDKKLCWNCLKPGHFASRCWLRRTCSVPGCGAKHTKFLHMLDGTDTREPSAPVVPAVISEAQSTFAEVDHGVNYSVSGPSQAMRIALPIVPVIVRAPGSRRSMHTFALLDPGSTNTFCSQELVQQLGVSGEKELLSLTTLERTNSETETLVVCLEVSDVSKENVLKIPEVYTRTVLSVNLNNLGRSEDLNKWKHLEDVKFPEIDARKVDLLIGQDVPDALIPIDLRRGKPGDPYATKTILGWTLNGPLGGASSKRKATSNFVQVDHDLNEQLERFWKIEGQDSLVGEKRGLSIEDKRAVSIWEDSIRRREDGHYMLSVPFRRRPPFLPPNREMAEKRLESLRRQLTRDETKHKAYTDFMSDLLERGYAEKVEEDQLNRSDTVWYLPHHTVHNPKKPDKVRVVFDCKASFQGVSLNSQVLQGPDLLNGLLGVLLRFRQYPVAIMSDIEAMFHQVCVVPEDRDALRFLWWPKGDMDKEPEVYRMTVHLFGGTWSPSCCSFALSRTAEDNRDMFDAETVATVLKDFYVDDCLKSVVNETKAIRMVDQLCTLLKRGGFRLTKWISNSRNVLSTIEEEDRAKQVKGRDLNCEALPTERALGVYWDVELDCFSFKITLSEKPLTKRGLLSIVSSVYDPLGFACPFTITARKLIQDLTRSKLDWDDVLPDDALETWLCWRQDLEKMGKFKVRRCIQPELQGEIVQIQLHHFADASQMAYGAASYIRLTDSEGHVHCCLLMAKSRLAPIKQLTIPRLELTAATLAVRLDHMIRRELNLPIHSSTFWTDSTCVLQYVISEDRRFHTFVENRVSTIREGSSPMQWRYVDSQSNPADECSRGLSADEMLSQQRWSQGPAFLMQEESTWPKTPDLKQQNLDNDPEIKKATTYYAVHASDTTSLDKLLERRSSWHALKKNIAWLLRFKEWIMKKNGNVVKVGPLSVEETEAAEIAVIQYLQRQHFGSEVAALDSTCGNGACKVKRSSSLFRLGPVMSSKGVLVIGGRLQNAPLPEDVIHQMILPRNHHVVDLIVKDAHEKLGHSGREYVLSDIRQKYWIVGARSTVRRVLSGCFDCKRRCAPPCGQKMADLPENRVTPGDAPFTYVGVDFFGPFFVKRGRSQLKRYGCLFTCFAIRAVHIEVAHSLDTHSFINALQRFMSRRGQPKEITSDNGTNFVGAEKELREAIAGWNQKQIHEYLHQNGIQWNFNPPAASHMGGVWERLIRTVRKVLRAVMKEQVVDDEGLSTLLCVVEAIVNGRPLTTVSADPKDLESLTPNHLLLLRSGPSLPPGCFVKEDLYTRRRWRQVQYMANLFWSRWVKEYLPILQNRQKWFQPKRNLEIGDIVLVVGETTPRSVWPIARVVKTFPGRDG